jgi:thiol-disulfide isomerase/thioredoxin
MTKKSKTADRISGVITFLLMLTAFLLVSRRVINVGMGPLPLGPGKPAPEISSTYVNGGDFLLTGYKGQIVLLDFWATWCPPCVAAMPELQRISQEYAASGVAVVGVNQEPNSIPKVRRFLREREISFPSIIDPGDIAQTFGVVSFPTTIIVDHEGLIRVVHRGAVSGTRLEVDIKRLIESKKRMSP